MDHNVIRGSRVLGIEAVAWKSELLLCGLSMQVPPNLLTHDPQCTISNTWWIAAVLTQP